MTRKSALQREAERVFGVGALAHVYRVTPVRWSAWAKNLLQTREITLRGCPSDAAANRALLACLCALPDAKGAKREAVAGRWTVKREDPPWYEHTSGAIVWMRPDERWGFARSDGGMNNSPAPTLAAAKRLALGGKAGRR